MKRFVVTLLAIFAIIIFIRDFSGGNSASASEVTTIPVVKAELVP